MMAAIPDFRFSHCQSLFPSCVTYFGFVIRMLNDSYGEIRIDLFKGDSITLY